MGLTARPWGDHAISFSLPVSDILFLGLSASQFDELSEQYKDFLHNPSGAGDREEYQCQAYRLDKAICIPINALSQNDLYTPLKRRTSSRIELTGFNFKAEVNCVSASIPSSLGVFMETEFTRPDVVENFLRIFSAHKALRLNGVMLHSAGLVFDDQAYIFTGRSNAGKTTLTRKAHDKGAWVLSDDINLLMPSDDGYRAHAVPFTGEFGRTLQHQQGRKSYPVAGIVLLEQADALDALPVSTSTAVARLLTGCPFVNSDPEESATLFDILTALVSKVPVIKLRNRRDDPVETIMEMVKNELKNAG